jgi:hypothetical protein
LDIFKKDFMSERRALGLSVNPADKDFWSALRASWTSIGDARLQNYESQAESSKVEAHAEARSRKLQAARPAPAVASALPEGGVQAAPALAANSILVATSRLPPQDQPLSHFTPASVQPEYPMAIEVLDAVTENQQVMNVASAFRNCHDQVQPNLPEDVPPHVAYPKQCRGLCERDTPKDTLRMQKALLAQLAKRCPPSAVAADLLLAFEVERSGEGALACFALLCMAAGKYGRFPPVQSFLKIDILVHSAADDYAGAVVRGVCDNHVAIDACNLPKQFRYYADVAQGVGAFATVDESDLTANVLSHLLPDWPDSVVVKFLEVAPDFCHFNVQGGSAQVTQMKICGYKVAFVRTK